MKTPINRLTAGRSGALLLAVFCLTTATAPMAAGDGVPTLDPTELPVPGPTVFPVPAEYIVQEAEAHGLDPVALANLINAIHEYAETQLGNASVIDPTSYSANSTEIIEKIQEMICRMLRPSGGDTQCFVLGTASFRLVPDGLEPPVYLAWPTPEDRELALGLAAVWPDPRSVDGIARGHAVISLNS